METEQLGSPVDKKSPYISKDIGKALKVNWTIVRLSVISAICLSKTTFFFPNSTVEKCCITTEAFFVTSEENEVFFTRSFLQQEFSSPGVGRRIIATAPYQKETVVHDYHGVETVHNNGFSLDNYCAENPDKKAVFEERVLNRNKEQQTTINRRKLGPCSRHPGRSCFGRLCNQAYKKNEGSSSTECNLRPVDFCCDKLFYGRGSKDSGAFRRVVFVATKDIQPFEQLMLDYGHDMSQYVN